MLTLARVLLMLSLIWAIAALTVQVRAVRRRRDYSRPAGDPRRGVVYSFTTAMLPTHKEAARLHAVEFGAGTLMHVGVIAALAQALASLGAVSIPVPVWLALPLWTVSLVAGLGLLARRMVARDLRVLSAPDDYLALLTTIGLLAFAGWSACAPAMQAAFLIYTAALLAYLPLGKLRHAVFFFVARADYGRRLGYRGVWPPADAGAE